VTSPTNVSFWPDDPVKLNWDPHLLVSVNLARNPEAVRQGTIQRDPQTGLYAVDVDDFAGYGTGGLTRIGPMFPGGATLGICYLEESKCAALGAYDPRSKPHAYEFATVVYHDGPMAGRCFHGFHANIVKANGNLGLVSLWARGTGSIAGQPPMGTFWLDFAAQVHAVEPGLTQVVPVTNPTGAIFIDFRASSGGGGVIPFDKPKAPQYAGGAAAIRRSYAC
jgi:hypothetical protein